jgi:hypothetical protein
LSDTSNAADKASVLAHVDVVRGVEGDACAQTNRRNLSNSCRHPLHKRYSPKAWGKPVPITLATPPPAGQRATVSSLLFAAHVTGWLKMRGYSMARVTISHLLPVGLGCRKLCPQVH